MNFIGIDLHKKTISVCVVNQERKVLKRRTLCCAEPERIVAFFREWGEFRAVVEATASYEWLWQLLEPLAQGLVLAHPGKLRVIAESKNKSDKLDAQVLAEFLALDMIPPAYRPTPRQRQHRTLVRQRVFVKKNLTRVRNKIRRVLSNYNADRPDLFTKAGLTYLQEAKKKVSAADQFVLDQLLEEWHYHRRQFQAVGRQLQAFARQAPLKEKEIRAVLRSMPSVGPTTVEVVLSEIGDIARFAPTSGWWLMRAWRRGSANRPAARRSWASPSKGRVYCAGSWSRRPGGRCAAVCVGGRYMRTSRNAAGRRKRSWR